MVLVASFYDLFITWVVVQAYAPLWWKWSISYPVSWHASLTPQKQRSAIVWRLMKVGGLHDDAPPAKPPRWWGMSIAYCLIFNTSNVVHRPAHHHAEEEFNLPALDLRARRSLKSIALYWD